MHCFIVSQWNGLDSYDGGSDYTVGVFGTLDEAVKFCRDTDPTADYYGGPLERGEAYVIEEWQDTTRVAMYTWEGNKK